MGGGGIFWFAIVDQVIGVGSAVAEFHCRENLFSRNARGFADWWCGWNSIIAGIAETCSATGAQEGELH